MPSLLAILFTAFAAPQPPDLVVVNANVLTTDAKRPAAEAFALRTGRFTAVGTGAETRPLAGTRTTVLDPGGRAFTFGSAYDELAETQKGSVGAGKLAGFVVPDAAPAGHGRKPDLCRPPPRRNDFRQIRPLAPCR